MHIFFIIIVTTFFLALLMYQLQFITARKYFLRALFVLLFHTIETDILSALKYNNDKNKLRYGLIYFQTRLIITTLYSIVNLFVFFRNRSRILMSSMSNVYKNACSFMILCFPKIIINLGLL